LSAQSLTITSKVGLQAMFLYQLCLFIVTKKEFFGTWYLVQRQSRIKLKT